MRITVIGGGPAGLYAALLLKKRYRDWHIEVYERNPAGATYGWGVVFSDRTLGELREADYTSYTEITDNFVIWDTIDVWYRGQLTRCRGHVFAGIARRKLLAILQARCRELGVLLHFEAEIEDPTQFISSADVLIAADGVNSVVRSTFAEVFRPSMVLGTARYIWLGTDKVLDAFTFIFRETEHGLFQVHAYPFDGNTSTFIVECSEDTWRHAGLDQADEAESLAFCQQLFSDHLGEHRLLSNRSRWIRFITLRNRTWHYENMVLLGDAAHTAHFSIGSGTKLAMEDAIVLANAFEEHGDDLEAVFDEYESLRKPKVEAFQQAAVESQTYFEHVRRYLHMEPVQFTFHLLTRSGRMSFDNLRLRDPTFINAVEHSCASDDGKLSAALFVPPPLLTPVRLGPTQLPNRLVLALSPDVGARDGVLPEAFVSHVLDGAHRAPALLLFPPVAVSAEGRMTPECPGLYRPEHRDAWATLMEQVHASTSARVIAHLSHAGRRGATRPRRHGLDLPLPPEAQWPLLAPSPLPYTPMSPTPRAMDRQEMEQVREAFVRAARLAAEAGVDVLQINMAHGYLLASFLSPLTNRREDEYGGPLENRMRYPLEVFQAVRAVWPEERPLGVTLTVSDQEPEGFTPEEAVTVGRELKMLGCDFIQVAVGQTTPHTRPAYGPAFLKVYSDLIRNEVHIPTVCGGYLTTADHVNTLVAAGRADLCIVSLEDYP
ncbi:MAG: FAD-dependent monooxygenase [Ardenticatenia bacterium]|nr:FAD-dependent monooxygenase [Ardenticatenia bacterium]